MNGSSILKKVLPILCSIFVIIVISIVVTNAKNNSNKAPELTDGDADYIKLSEVINGESYNYSVTKGELYAELKSGIGLSSVITMMNKEILKKEIYEGSTSFFDAVKQEDIEKEFETAVYGEDVDVNTLTEEEKSEKLETYLDTMYTGYGYDTSSMNEIYDHFRLILAKKLYAQVKLHEEIEEKQSTDKPYFDDDKLDKYYEENYDKGYWALVIPFSSQEQAKLLLQQYNVIISTNWYHSEVKENPSISGSYEYIRGTNPLTTLEVIETFIKMYNTVYGYKQKLVEGTVSLVDGKYVFNDNCDYAYVDMSASATQVNEKYAALKNAFTTETTKEEKIAAIKGFEEALKQASGIVYVKAKVEDIINTLPKLEKLANGETISETSETIFNNIDANFEVIENAKTIIFNTDKEDSLFRYEYKDLYSYDSGLPSKLNNSLSKYIPFATEKDLASTNSTDATWFTRSPITSNSIYYFILYIDSTLTPEFKNVKEEILAKLEEEALTDDLIEKKMSELRKEHNIVIFDKDLEKGYVSNNKKYDVEYKESKKKNKDVVASIDNFEITTESLFKFMEKTLGLTNVINEIAYKRLLNNTYFNKYYDAETKKWLGEEGKDLKELIIENIETQRLNFLAGAYQQYGYTPQNMSWEEFLKQINGADDEYELAMLMLYGNVSSDYIKTLTNFLNVDGEGKDLEFVVDYNKANEANSLFNTLVVNRMNDIVNDSFTVNGEHLLVSKYDTVNDAINSNNPINPSEWTEEEKNNAKALINDIKKYLEFQEGSYSSKLNNVVNAFKNSPYNVVDTEGKYVKVVDANGEQYEYTLPINSNEVIDISKYKSLGFSVKYESLGSFGAGKMVKNFEDAAKEIWLQDKADNLTDRITVYKDAIETIFGFHLYINLGSTFAKTYTAKTLDANGNVVEVENNIIPTLYEIRLNSMIKALEAVNQAELKEEEVTELKERIKELKENLSTEAQTAITTYFDVVTSELTGSYFASLCQHVEIKNMLETSFVISSPNQFTKDDIINLINVNKRICYRDGLKQLKDGDEVLFDITKNYVK